MVGVYVLCSLFLPFFFFSSWGERELRDLFSVGGYGFYLHFFFLLHFHLTFCSRHYFKIKKMDGMLASTGFFFPFPPLPLFSRSLFGSFFPPPLVWFSSRGAL